MKKVSIYICVFIFLFQDILQVIFPFKIVSFLDELLIIFLFILSILKIIRKGKLEKRYIKMNYLIIVFIFAGIISCLLNSNYDIVNMLESSFLSIKFMILITSTMNLPIKEETLNVFIKAVLFYGRIVALVAILNIIFPDLYMKILGTGFISYRFGLVVPCSLFVHPGVYGWFMLFIAIYYYSRYLEKYNKRYRAKFIFYSFMAVLSFKVKVIVSLVSIFIFGMIVRNNYKIKLKQVILIFISLIVTWLIFGEFLNVQFKMYFTSEFGLSARQSLLNNSIKILFEYFPLGVGFSKFGSYYARINYSEYYYKYNMDNIYGLQPMDPRFATDTYWPSVFGETGFLGSVIFISFIGYILKNIYIKYKLNGYDYYRLFGILIMIQALGESIAEPIFNSSPQNIFIGLVIGFAMSSNIIKNSQIERI